MKETNIRNTEYYRITTELVIKKGIPLNNRKILNTILYADDQILMATSEDELQIMA